MCRCGNGADPQRDREGEQETYGKRETQENTKEITGSTAIDLTLSLRAIYMILYHVPCPSVTVSRFVSTGVMLIFSHRHAFLTMSAVSLVRSD